MSNYQYTTHNGKLYYRKRKDAEWRDIYSNKIVYINGLGSEIK